MKCCITWYIYEMLYNMVYIYIYILFRRNLSFHRHSSVLKTEAVLSAKLWYIYTKTHGVTSHFILHTGLLARSQYSEGSATGHLDTGFSWFPCVYKQMLRWFPTFQVATTCFLYSPPDLNLVVTDFMFCLHEK